VKCPLNAAPMWLGTTFSPLITGLDAAQHTERDCRTHPSEVGAGDPNDRKLSRCERMSLCFQKLANFDSAVLERQKPDLYDLARER
jgi:hypothetical protein